MSGASQQRAGARRRGAEAVHLEQALVEHDTKFLQWLMGLAVLALVGVGVVLWLEGLGVFPRTDTGIVLLGGMLSVVVLSGRVRQWRARRVVPETEAWLRGQPFAVEGYFEVLGAQPEARAVVEATVRFAPGQAPSEERLREALQGVELEQVAPGEPEVVLRSVPIDCDTGEEAAHNGPLHLWMRKLVAEVLVPLHAAHPLQGVSLRRAALTAEPAFEPAPESESQPI